jgi:hypothetical protein
MIMISFLSWEAISGKIQSTLVTRIPPTIGNYPFRIFLVTDLSFSCPQTHFFNLLPSELHMWIWCEFMSKSWHQNGSVHPQMGTIQWGLHHTEDVLLWQSLLVDDILAISHDVMAQLKKIDLYSSRWRRAQSVTLISICDQD